MSTTSETTTTPVAYPVTGAKISAKQKEINLHTASHLVAAQMGVDPMGLTYDQTLAYTRALSLVITKYPTRFTEQSVINAQTTLNKNRTPLEDTGFDIDAFGRFAIDEAVKIGDKVGNVGKNVLDAVENTSLVVKYGVPLILLLGFGLFVYIKAGGKRYV